MEIETEVYNTNLLRRVYSLAGTPFSQFGPGFLRPDDSRSIRKAADLLIGTISHVVMIAIVQDTPW